MGRRLWAGRGTTLAHAGIASAAATLDRFLNDARRADPQVRQPVRVALAASVAKAEAMRLGAPVSAILRTTEVVR